MRNSLESALFILSVLCGVEAYNEAFFSIEGL